MKQAFQLFVLSLTLLPCTWAAAAPAAASRPNVILVTIDTVRADHLGCYGYKQIQTPTIDGLANDGIVFERAISQVPLTWPSHAAILTGTYPFQNGVQDFTGQPLAPQFRSVVEELKEHGYATGAVISAFVLDRSWGLARGFDFYDDAFAPEAFLNRDLGLIERRAGESVTRALGWARKNSRKPFFLWLHLYDPHSPYDPPEPYRSQYKGSPYDGEIAYADHELGRLVSWLKANRLYDKSMIVFLSDHGEALKEHGEHEHGFFIYNSTLHIPLIVKPAVAQGFQPRRVSRAVETTSIPRTLLSGAGVKMGIEKQFHSKGLLDAAAEHEDQAYSETFYPFSSFGWSPLRSLETSRFHYIDAPSPELYDVVADPQEKNNLVSTQTATVAVLKEKLSTISRQNMFQPADSADSGMSPDALDKLRALGYVAYRSPVSLQKLVSGLPDPKDKLWELNAILEAGDAFRAGDTSSGKALLAQTEQKDPQMYVVPFMLGEAAAREGKWEEATEAFQKCLRLNPDFDQAMTGLAQARFKQGDLEGAKSSLDSALKRNPQNYRAWFELGSLQSKADRVSAVSAYEKSVAIQPNFALAWRELGILQSRQQNYIAAANSLFRAVVLGLDDAKVFNFLGIAYSRTNRHGKAVEAYQRALQIDPQLAEAHLNLAYAYEQIHKPTLASKQYQEACRLRADFCHVVRRDK